MKEINWKVRIKNKIFWIALIPAVLLLIQTGCAVFGIELDFGSLQDKLIWKRQSGLCGYQIIQKTYRINKSMVNLEIRGEVQVGD